MQYAPGIAAVTQWRRPILRLRGPSKALRVLIRGSSGGWRDADYSSGRRRTIIDYTRSRRNKTRTATDKLCALGLESATERHDSQETCGFAAASQVQQQSPRSSPAAQPESKNRHRKQLCNTSNGSRAECQLGLPTIPNSALMPRTSIRRGHIRAAEAWVEKRGGVLSNVLQRPVCACGCSDYCRRRWDRHDAAWAALNIVPIKSETDPGRERFAERFEKRWPISRSSDRAERKSASVNGNHAASGGFSGGMFGGLLTAQQSTGNGGSSDSNKFLDRRTAPTVCDRRILLLRRIAGKPQLARICRPALNRSATYSNPLLARLRPA